MLRKEVVLIEHEREDEEQTLLAIAEAELDAEVVVSRDGAAAIEYLRTPAVDPRGNRPRRAPDLVLIDLSLPEVDGLEVIRRLRRDPRTELTPIVVFTRSRSESDVVDAVLMGANSFVRKPRDPHLHREVVQQICRYWLTVTVAARRER